MKLTLGERSRIFRSHIRAFFDHHLRRASIFDAWKVVGVDVYQKNDEQTKYLVKLEPLRKNRGAIISNSEFTCENVVFSFGPQNYKTTWNDLPTAGEIQQTS